RRHRGLRRLALVGDHRRDLAAAELAAVALEPELPGALQLVADRRVDAGLRHDHADLDLAATAATGLVAAFARRDGGERTAGSHGAEQAPPSDPRSHVWYLRCWPALVVDRPSVDVHTRRSSRMFVGSALGVKRYPGWRVHGAGLDRAGGCAALRACRS